MKKLALTLFLFSSVLLSYDSIAQKDSGYDKGTVLINGGIGVGTVVYDPGLGGVSIPAIQGNVEWSVHPYIGIGPYVGFGGYADGSYFGAGVRGTFHYAQFIPGINTDQVDLYGTLMIGSNFYHRNYTRNGVTYNDNYSRFVPGPVAGARYFFGGGGFGAFGELGWGPFGFFSIGLSGRF